MGGDTENNMAVSYTDEFSSIGHQYSHLSSSILRDDDLSSKSESIRNCLAISDLEAKRRRRDKDFKEILRSHEELRVRSQGLEEAKAKILSYKPGAWIEHSGGLKPRDYDVPATTTILLVGPKGAGKSSLVNRISKVFEDDKFASERAQVTYDSSVGDGTLFLQEYMIPRGSSSFCLYDTRSLSDNLSENVDMLKNWMTKGVRNGQPVTRDSDDQSLINRIECHNGSVSGIIRKVNFVIFVVNGLSVLKSLDNDEEVNGLNTEIFVSAFKSPYVSFRDDKPLVVVTHGDLLSHFDRARICVHLGELLGIPPTKQIFDIPEELDPETELTIVDMLCFALEHADKNLPRKSLLNRINKITSPVSIFLLFMLLVVVFSFITASVLNNLAKSPKHAELQAPTQFLKPLEKYDIQGQAKPSNPQAKYDIHGQANSPKPQGKEHTQQIPKPLENYDIQGLEKNLKADAKEKIRGWAKYAKARAKDETKRQWHEIRHLWLGDEA